jgi:hypothetical protein
MKGAAEAINRKYHPYSERNLAAPTGPNEPLAASVAAIGFFEGQRDRFRTEAGAIQIALDGMGP